jgi:hypothetical protein
MRILRTLFSLTALLAAAIGFADPPAGLKLAEPKLVRKQHAIKGQYLVVFRNDVSTGDVPGLARALARTHETEPVKIWTRAVKGFYVQMPAARAEALSRHPMVEYVEENGRTFISATTMPTDRDPATCPLPNGQNCPPTSDNRLWFLDRVDQDSAIPSRSFSYCTTGSSVKIYVIDFGVQGNHSEFLDANGNSRVAQGKNATDDPFPANDPCGGWPLPIGPGGPGSIPAQTDDDNYTGELNAGHGTGVASIAAGKKVGIAKDAAIIPVKVARCDGYRTRYRIPGEWYDVGDWVHDVEDPPDSSFWKLHKRWIAVTSGRASTDRAQDWMPDANGQFVDDNPNDSDPGIVWQEHIGVPATVEEYQTTQMLIEGLEWVLQDRSSLPTPKTAAIATLSVWEPILDTGVLGTGSTVQQAVGNLIADNVTVIAAANNQGMDACQQAPGAFSRWNPVVNRRDKVITVGGSMLLNEPGQGYDGTQPTLDARWKCTGACPSAGNEGAGSNAGPCVTLFAPAKGIVNAQRRSATDYRDPSSGTSWSAPMVAGVVAGYLQANSTMAPDDVYNLLLARASNGVLDDSTLDTDDVTDGSTPNEFLRASDVSFSAHPQDGPSTASNPAVLSFSATGTAPLSYQWFQVNDDFASGSRRGAADSFPLSGETGPTLTRHPSEETGYWVRVTGCGADSDIAVVTPAPPPPEDFEATANPDGSIALSWNSVSGANRYVVERRVAGGSWQQLGSPVTGTTLTDGTLPPSLAALYRVRARKDGPPAVDSDPSNVDFSHSWVLTDLSVSSGTLVRALHLTELRRILNQVADIDLSDNFSRLYTDEQALESALKDQLIDDAHFTDLMSKINSLRFAFGLGNESFGTEPLANARFYASQVQDLRRAIR